MRLSKGIARTALACFVIASTSTALAAKTITVSTYVAKKGSKGLGVVAVGFSVNNKGEGSLGSRTTKTGPANKLYTFGIKSMFYGNITCGHHTLKRDSVVVMRWNKKTRTCTHKVYLKK